MRIVQRAEALKNEPDRGMTEREDWPSVCKDRLARDMENLKEIVRDR